MANIEKIVLPDNTEYDVKDTGAFHKSAGSDELITDSIHIDCSDSTYKSINFSNSGTNIAKLQKQGVSGALILATIDSQGSSLAGMDVSSNNNTIIFADGTDDGIFLRPKGLAETAGQVWIDTSGQQHGGHPIKTQSPSSAVTVGNSWASVCTITGLDSSGLYLVDCYVQYTPNANTSHHGWAGFGSSASSHIIVQSIYSNSTGVKYCSFSGFYTGSSSIVLSATSTTSAVSATIGSGSHIKVVRIN